jgi:hypothetical protein
MLVGLQGFATQVNVLKLPLVPHVAIPPPAYPMSHKTVTVCPVVPFILLAAALLELMMLPVGVQVFGAHVNVLNVPSVPQVACFGISQKFQPAPSSVILLA